jgi:hypothetical protein
LKTTVFLCMDYFISLNMFKFKTTQNIPSSRLVFIQGIFSPQSPHGCEILVLYKFTGTCCFHYQGRKVRCVEINICGRRNSRGFAFFRPKRSEFQETLLGLTSQNRLSFCLRIQNGKYHQVDWFYRWSVMWIVYDYGSLVTGRVRNHRWQQSVSVRCFRALVNVCNLSLFGFKATFVLQTENPWRYSLLLLDIVHRVTDI